MSACKQKSPRTNYSHSLPCLLFKLLFVLWIEGKKTVCIDGLETFFTRWKIINYWTGYLTGYLLPSANRPDGRVRLQSNPVVGRKQDVMVAACSSCNSLTRSDNYSISSQDIV